jgi:hypothetical protein
MWPTPQAFDATNLQRSPAALARAKQKGGCANLREAVLATPTSNLGKSGNASATTHLKNSRPLNEQVGGTLNPTWVEWLMGWCLGWTALEPLAMAGFHKWRSQHGISCMAD